MGPSDSLPSVDNLLHRSKLHASPSPEQLNRVWGKVPLACFNGFLLNNGTKEAAMFFSVIGLKAVGPVNNGLIGFIALPPPRHGFSIPTIDRPFRRCTITEEDEGQTRIMRKVYFYLSHPLEPSSFQLQALIIRCAQTQ